MRVWWASSSYQSTTGPVSTSARIRSRYRVSSVVRSTIAPPMDQPKSTTSEAPCPRAYSMPAWMSSHSVNPRPYRLSSVVGASWSLR